MTNLSTYINIDGNQGNFTELTGNTIAGDGGQIANITGANVTGEVASANVVTNPSQTAITQVGTLTALTTGSLDVTGQLTANANAQFNGDVFFAGNVTIPGNINQVSGNSGQFFGNAVTGFGALYAGLPAGYTLLNQEVMQYSTSFNGYTQVSLRNINGGDQSTGDFVITADNGTDFINHIDLGMAGSGYSGLAANNSLGTSLLPNDGYLYTRGNVTGGNLVLGSNQANGVVRIIANGQSNLSDVVATFAASGLSVNGAISGNANLTVTGNVSGGNILGPFVGNGSAITNITGANVTGAVANATYATSANAATFADTVTTAAQPNITSVGTLSSLSVTGNVSAGNIISAGTFQSATITSPSIAIPYSNTVAYTANVITLNGNTLWRANSNIAANIPFAIGNTANTWSMVEQWTKTSRAWYVDPINGLDSNDGSSVSPLKTIARAAQIVGGSGFTIALYPGTYSETITWTDPNINIIGIGLGSAVRFTSTFTVNLTSSPSSSVRISGVRFNDLVFTGTGGGVYLDTCQIDQLTHSGTGYLELVDCESEVGLVTVSGGGTLSAFQGNLRRLTVANAAALVTTQDVVFTSANIIVTAGTALINNGIISAPSATANVITSSAGTAVYVNYTTMNTTTGANARVSLGGFYSFTGAVVDTANSVLGTNLSAVQVTDSLNVLGLANAASINSRTTITSTGNITTAAGNVSGGNLLTGGRVVATGNIVTSAQVVATGNVSGNFFIGNGSQLTGITSTISGNLAGNLLANGFFINNLASLSVTGNVTGGNLVTAGNVTGAFILGNISQATGLGNISTVNLNGNVNTVLAGDGTFVAQNTYGNSDVFAYLGSNSNVVVTTTGNVTADYFIGNISQATGLGNISTVNLNGNGQTVLAGNGTFVVPSSGTASIILNGTSNVTIPTADGNIIFNRANVFSGQISQTSVSLGAGAGANAQGIRAVAIGQEAGNTGQSTSAVAVGRRAGQTNQGQQAVAIGQNAGNDTQGITATAVGASAGSTTQGINAVAVGYLAGSSAQGANAVSVGYEAGFENQGQNSVAIGYGAGRSGQPANSIMINASLSSLNGTNEGFYVNPVRNDTGNVTNVVYYNTTTKEVTYGPASGGSSYGDANVFAYLGSNSNVVITTTGNITSANLTSTRVIPRVGTVTSGATITPTGDSSDQYTVTALAESATVAAPSGTPADGQKLTIRIIDNGSAQALTWNAIYQEIGTTLPTTTVASKYVYIGCVYNAQSSKWDVVSVAQQA